MKARSGILIVILFVLATVSVIYAQQTPEPTPALRRSAPEPASFYRLDFVIREMDGEKPVDSRKYSMWVQSGKDESMTAGSEVPYPGVSYSKEGTGTTKSTQYRSVGVSIHCTVREDSGAPQLFLRLNISEALPPATGSDAPVFRKISIESNALLNLGKPTSVGVVEDPANRHRFQVDVTATKLN